MTQRDKFEATIFRFMSKRYYKNTGLPYSYVILKDVIKNGSPMSGNWAGSVEVKYGQTLHKLECKRFDRISFTAEVDEEGRLKNTRNFTKTLTPP